MGGKSYGSYQLTVNSGHAQKFAQSYGGSLAGLKAGTAAFDAAWKKEAANNSAKFQAAQHNYIAQNHYQPAVSALKSATGIDVNKFSIALQNVVWSIGVQHGAGGAKSIFSRAGINANMSEKQIIERIYAERSKVNVYFSKSPQNIKNSVANRFKSELQGALAMLGY